MIVAGFWGAVKETIELAREKSGGGCKRIVEKLGTAVDSKAGSSKDPEVERSGALDRDL